MELAFSQTLMEQYSMLNSSLTPTYLGDLERETHLKINKPQMLTGWLQGRMLSLFSKLMRPNRILEIGTFTGYGSLCLAEGLSPHGKLITLEVSEENGWLARKYFERSPFATQIELKMGKAVDMLQEVDEVWDLVYIDADKIHNQEYFEAVWPKVRSGGMVLIDNVFARGAVWKEDQERKPFEQAVVVFNSYLVGLKDGYVQMLAIRDGLTAIVKN